MAKFFHSASGSAAQASPSSHASVPYYPNIILSFYHHANTDKKAIVLYTESADLSSTLLLQVLRRHFVVFEPTGRDIRKETLEEYLLNPEIWKCSPDGNLLLQLLPDSGTRSNTIFMESAIKVVLRFLDDDTFNYRILAKELFLSISQLNKRLNQISGQSANEFIRTTRLEHAKHLLLTTEARVKEVAYSTGFSCLTRFDQAFKDYFGVSPTKCRQTAISNEYIPQ